MTNLSKAQQQYLAQRMIGLAKGMGIKEGNANATKMPPKMKQVQQVIRKTAKSAEREYISLVIKNESLVTASVLLWDASSAYQRQNPGYIFPAGVTITAPSKDYPTILRNMVQTTFYIDEFRFACTAGKEVSQFEHNLLIYQDTMRNGNVTLDKTIYPSEGLGSWQQQPNRVEVEQKGKIGYSTSMITDVEPETTLTIRFYIEQAVTFG